MSEFDQDKDYQLLHKKYQEASTEVPAASIDASILQAAHRAVESTGNEKTTSGMDTQSVKRSWFVPLSYVAILVVSLSVVMKLALEPPMMESPVYETSEYIAEESSAPQRNSVNGTAVRNEIMTQDMSAQIQAENLQRKIHASQREKKVAQRPMLQKQMQFAAEETKAKARTKARVDKLAEKPLVASVASAPVESVTVQNQLAGAGDYADTSANRVQSDDVESVNELQKLQIEKMLVLLKLKKFDELKQVLIDYRKEYPLNEQEVLPEKLRNWEKNNISQPPHTK